jgi:hypothetical protein
MSVIAGWFTAQAGPRGACSIFWKVSTSTPFLFPLPPLMTLFKLPYAERLLFFDSAVMLPLLSPANLSLELLASGTAISVLSAADHPCPTLEIRPRPTKAPIPVPHVSMISPCGGRCASYSSARLSLLRAQISAIASMASRISGSTARRMAENEKSSTEGSPPLFPARLVDKADGFCIVCPFMLGNRRGVLRPEDGLEL